MTQSGVFSTADIGGTGSQASSRGRYRSSSAFPLLFADSMAIAGALLITSLFVDSDSMSGHVRLFSPASLITALAVISLWQLNIGLMGGYAPHILHGLRIAFKRLILASLFFFGVLAIVEVTVLDILPAELFSVGLPFGVLLLSTFRLLVRTVAVKRKLVDRQAQPHMVLKAPSTSLDFLTHNGREDAPIVGHIRVDEALKSPSPVDFILDALAKNKAKTLLVSPSCNLTPEQLQVLRWALEDASIQMAFLLPLLGVSEHRIQTRNGLKATILDIRPARHSGWHFRSKRLGDILIASVSIIALTPVWIAVALIIRLSDGGPASFRQVRVGLHGRPFTMYKFRTMGINAEEELQDMVRALGPPQDSGNEILFKLKSDPRITRFGRFLRRYSIDELPQLFNVLRGNMSLVGPRPPLPHEVTQYEPRVLRKFLIKPGLTGLWQTMGRSNLTWEDSVYLDLYYSDNCTPWLDFRILLNTFRSVLSPDGAY